MDPGILLWAHIVHIHSNKLIISLFLHAFCSLVLYNLCSEHLSLALGMLPQYYADKYLVRVEANELNHFCLSNMEGGSKSKRIPVYTIQIYSEQRGGISIVSKRSDSELQALFSKPASQKGCFYELLFVFSPTVAIFRSSHAFFVTYRIHSRYMAYTIVQLVPRKSLFALPIP
jgi:hypothetical protein